MAEETHIPVVLRYRDGRTRRCSLTGEFSPKKATIEVQNEDGERISVELDELKAVFFVKDPRRRELEMAIGVSSDFEPGSALARVEFFDGEVIRGRVQGYSLAHKGFYLYPTAVESNNWRVFVVASALATLAFDG
jgi:hypothetical protein